MKSSEIIKWVAIAGAAYLVFRYLQTQGMLGGQPKPQEALPPGSEDAKPPERPKDFASVTRDSLYNFAASHMPPTWDGRLTVSEWNWMVSNLTGVDQQQDLGGGPDPIYAEEYLGLRKTAGISGVDRLAGLQRAFGGYQMGSGWSM
jgi:hypothetical protein